LGELTDVKPSTIQPSKVSTRTKQTTVIPLRITRAQSQVPITNPAGPAWRDNLCAQDTATILLYYLYSSICFNCKALFKQSYPQLVATFDIVSDSTPDIWRDAQRAISLLVYRERY